MYAGEEVLKGFRGHTRFVGRVRPARLTTFGQYIASLRQGSLFYGKVLTDPLEAHDTLEHGNQIAILTTAAERNYYAAR